MVERRPFTPEERKVLAGMLEDLGRPGHWGSGLFMSMSLTLLAGVPTIAFGVRFLHWSRAAIVVVLIGLFTAGLATWAWLMRRRPEGGTGLQADLDAGVADVERHLASDAVRVVMEGQRERGYFMNLKDGRVMFLGFWSPSTDDNPAGISHLPPDLPRYPTGEFEIVRAPLSRTRLAITFKGPTLPDVKTIEYRENDPDLRLNAFDIVPVPWSDVLKTYGGGGFRRG